MTSLLAVLASGFVMGNPPDWDKDFEKHIPEIIKMWKEEHNIREKRKENKHANQVVFEETNQYGFSTRRS